MIVITHINIMLYETVWDMVDFALAHVRINECTSHKPRSCQCCTSDQEVGATLCRYDPMFLYVEQVIKEGERDRRKLFASVITEWKRRGKDPNQNQLQELKHALKLNRTSEVLVNMSKLFVKELIDWRWLKK